MQDPEQYQREKAAYYDDFEKRLKAVEVKKTGFTKFFLLHEFADVKNTYSKETIGAECSALVEALKEPLKLLDAIVREARAVMRKRTEFHENTRGPLVDSGQI